MPSSAIISARSHLFGQFQKKLKENEEVFSQYGSSFEEACQSLNYATAIRYEMINAEEDERLKQQVPSAHTILRWLQRGDFSAQVQSRCLLSVSRFLGFEHFDAFKQTADISEASTDNATDTVVPEIEPNRQPTKRRGLWWGLFGIALGTLLTYGFVVAVIQTKEVVQPPSELEVRSLIERANAFEYNLYAQVGRQALDTSGQHLFFSKEAPAWLTIDKVLRGSIRHGYMLNLDRSNRALVSTRIEEVSDSTVIVMTREAWTIIWASETAKGTRYDEVNEQYYTLLRENDHWKIHQNAYAGKYEEVAEEDNEKVLSSPVD